MSDYASDCGSLDDLFDEASLALVEVEVHSPKPRVSNPDAVRTSTATHHAAVLATESAERGNGVPCLDGQPCQGLPVIPPPNGQSQSILG